MRAKHLIEVLKALVVFVCLARILCATPPELVKYENAVCRIKVDNADGSTSMGSGVLLEPPETHRSKTGAQKNYILTAYHVVDERRSNDTAVTVTFDGDNYHPATVTAARPGCDATLLTLRSGSLTISGGKETPRIPIADAGVSLGEQVYTMGFGSSSESTLRCETGPVIVWTLNTFHDPIWFDFAGRTRQGDSGGPVFVLRGGTPYLVGLAWGSVYDKARSTHTVSATRLAVLKRLFGQEQAPVNVPSRSVRSSPVRVVVEEGTSGGVYTIPSSGGS